MAELQSRRRQLRDKGARNLMNLTCAQFDELLLDGSPAAMSAAGEHAAACSACGEVFAGWQDLSSTAQSLRSVLPSGLRHDLPDGSQSEWSRDPLWHRIERALMVRKPRRPMRRLMQIAAAILVAVSLGGTMVYAVRVQARDADFDRDILRVAAVDEVERAEKAHLQAIANLEKVAGKRLERADTPIAIAYREKLMLLDDAIAECEANIENNRQNAHLRGQLLAMYSEKQQTLKDVLREERHASN